MNALDADVQYRLREQAAATLLATRLAGVPASVRAEVLEAALDMRRAELLLRVAPPGEWRGVTPLALRVLGCLLDGEQWTRDALRRAVRVRDRQAREAVEVLRHAGFPVVSRSSKQEQGYRLTDDADEIEAYVLREVTPRAMRQHELEAAMRGAAQRVRASWDEGAVQPAQRELWEVA